MEDFTAKEKRGIKEKNLYILQLDTPRIIIITSVFFGLLVIAVLIGMNFNKAENERDIFADNNALYNDLLTEREKSDPFERNMMDPMPGPGEPAFKGPENEITSANNISTNKMPSGMSNEPAITGDNILKSGNNLLTGSNNGKIAEATDILTHENIESIIPPSNTLKKSKNEKKTVSRKKPVKKKKSVRKKDVVEVSSNRKHSLNKKIYRSPGKEKSYFAVQVASYDKKSRAITEAGRLEKKRYNAFIDSAHVNGKKYYRVRIGPIYSKKKACNLLDEITADNRYEESYIIKN